MLAITCSTQPILTENEINTIFYRVEDLHDLHAKLHNKLEALVQSWTPRSCVGNFFKELVRYNNNNNDKGKNIIEGNYLDTYNKLIMLLYLK